MTEVVKYSEISGDGWITLNILKTSKLLSCYFKMVLIKKKETILKTFSGKL